MDEDMARAEKMHALRQMEMDRRDLERDGRDNLGQRQEALARALAMLQDNLENLEQVLQPVLIDPQPTPDRMGPDRDPSVPLSPLSGFLRNTAGHAGELARRVTELANRVDL